jgi:hypothetical protein
MEKYRQPSKTRDCGEPFSCRFLEHSPPPVNQQKTLSREHYKRHLLRQEGVRATQPFFLNMKIIAPLVGFALLAGVGVSAAPVEVDASHIEVCTLTTSFLLSISFVRLMR